MSRTFCGIGVGVSQRRDQCQIVFRLVDRILRICRRGPPEASLTRRLRAPAQLVEARQLSLGGAKRLKPVERWNARARLLNVEPRIREIEPAACRADRKAQRKTFGRDSVLLSLHSLETLAECSL